MVAVRSDPLLEQFFFIGEQVLGRKFHLFHFLTNVGLDHQDKVPGKQNGKRDAERIKYALELQPVDYFRRATCVGEIRDRKSTRLNSSHVKISYAVFCLKK